MCFIDMELEYLLTHHWIQLCLRWRESHRYCFISPVSAWQYANSRSAAKWNYLPAKTDHIVLLFLPNEPALNEIWFLSFWSHLEFHFYLSIMHEVAEIRPRSAVLPCRGTLINTTALNCLSHLLQPVFHCSGCTVQDWECRLTACQHAITF